MEIPTREKVLSALPKYNIIHLACHGYSVDDPSQICFLLNDWTSTPLTVADITCVTTESAVFAYLSTCHSSISRNFELPDEMLSLSSAIQLAGYPSVVANLWSVTDENSAMVAEEVYAWMLDRERNRLVNLQSAEGLHWAVRGLRRRTENVSGFTRKGPSDPLIWGPYIHLGV